MELNEQSRQQIERFIRKIAQKFSNESDDPKLTDIHIRASQESGDLMAFDDDNTEITRCVVDEWIENKDNYFSQNTSQALQQALVKQKNLIESLNIMMPYSFVLEDEEGNNINELYLVDDDTVIIGGDLLKDLDADLNDFFNKLIKEN